MPLTAEDYAENGAKRQHKPTADQRRSVLMMVGFGILPTQIAKMIGIHHETLRKHYQHELDTGATEANLRVAQALYTNATKHMHVGAQVWWTKARMKWKETTVNEQLGTQTIQFQHLVAMREVGDRILKERNIEGRVIVADETNDAGAPAKRNLMEPALE
jgi:hypothetical protein